MNNNEDGISKAKLKRSAAKKNEQNRREGEESSSQPAIPLDFSVPVSKLLSRAESDRSSAMQLLEMLAQNLRARTLPNRMLANYVADAIEWAAAKPVSNQARSLTDELHLTSQERRPAHSWTEIGRAMDALIKSGISQTQAKLAVAVEFELDEKTALKYYKQYVAAKKLHDNIE